MTPFRAAVIAWIAWLISWLIAGLTAAPAVRRPVFGSESLHLIVTVIGCGLLFSAREFGTMYLTGWGGWIAFAVVLAGFAFAWWARIHLGRLWSGSVTRKADHHIVDTGPYGLVRHPIYTGLILSCIGQAAIVGDLRAVAGAALVAAGFTIKGRLEEGFLREQLGAEAYDHYRARTPMLIPWRLFAPAR